MAHAQKLALISRDSDKLERARRELCGGAQSGEARGDGTDVQSGGVGARGGNGTEAHGDRGAGAEVSIISANISDADSVNGALARAFREIGAPDVVIHSAGHVFPGAFESLTMDKMRKTIDTNLIGTWNVMQCTVPQLTSGALVIHIASFAALLGIFGYTDYAASKYATLGLCEALRNELRPRGITVKVVCPSDTDTPQLQYENRHKPPETKAIAGTVRPYTADYVARYLLTHSLRRPFLIIPGLSARIIWLTKRLFPSLVYAIIDRKVAKAYAAHK